jgi:hypothetical protein
MRLSQRLVVCAALALAPAALAQKWEFGAGAGGSTYLSHDVQNGGDTAQAGIETNLAASVWLDENGQGHWGGEVRYDYERGALQLKSGGATATFGAESHAMHYDFLAQSGSRGSRTRLFVAGGGGVKIYRGTGAEQPFQPLSQFALLTKTTDLRALVSVGAGVKFQISHALRIRLEVHDYMTPFPKEVITPNFNSSIGGGWLHNLVPMGGISYTF